ncbi:U-box domain-containing protein 28 [Vitis vinifera]|uniref:U-box domain-containing protein n=1 Tax=Vitis vinifera TaxID=29760 RepID=A0A438HKM9_VITVI|nr:U-box domain-containing protein 28 [Vitis vinifera]
MVRNDLFINIPTFSSVHFSGRDEVSGSPLQGLRPQPHPPTSHPGLGPILRCPVAGVSSRQEVCCELDGFVPVVPAFWAMPALELRFGIGCSDFGFGYGGKGSQRTNTGIDLEKQPRSLVGHPFDSRKSSSDSKIASARILEAIAIDPESKRSISEREGLVSVLLQLLSSQTDSSSLDSVLSCLIAITVTRQTKTQLVRSGLVQTLAKTLSTSNYPISTTEKSIKLLLTISNCRDGHQAICEDPICVAAVVQRMSMKLSSSAVEDAVTVLWSVCYLNRDSKAQEAVAKSTGLTKILLLMQTIVR